MVLVVIKFILNNAGFLERLKNVRPNKNELELMSF